jgi:hypothetical protein
MIPRIVIERGGVGWYCPLSLSNGCGKMVEIGRDDSFVLFGFDAFQ